MGKYLINGIGLLGDAFILIAYLMLQLRRMDSKGLPYLLLNLFGAAFILISLFFYWNLAAVVIEIAWILISFVGIYHYYYHPTTNKISES